MIPEPKDKLDAATASVGVVSGPEDVPFDRHAVDWRACEQNVRRLRQRIFTASKAGDLRRVRRLQKLMLRSRSNTLVSVRHVTERNAGRLTVGVDGEVVLAPEAKQDWPTGSSTRPSRSRPSRSDAYTSPSQEARSADH
jgi:RNA-directed DNA polymerase